MRSVCRRASDARASDAIVSGVRLRSGARPPPTLVATTIWSRFPRCASQRPMIVSDCPCSTRYEFAVSMKLPPACTYASSTACDSRSSAVQPKTLPPRQSGKTSRSVRPSTAMRLKLLGGCRGQALGGARDDVHGRCQLTTRTVLAADLTARVANPDETKYATERDQAGGDADPGPECVDRRSFDSMRHLEPCTRSVHARERLATRGRNRRLR